jgi:hypothetical protein
MLRPIVRQSLKQVDFLGCALLIAASVLVVFPFQEGGLGANRWSHAIFLAPIVVGVLCWILLFGWQVFVDRKMQGTIASIFPVRLMRRRVYFFAVILVLLIGFPFFSSIYTIPVRLQVVNRKSPIIAGISLLPMLSGGAVGSFLGGAISSRKNNTCIVLIVASCFLCIGSACESTLSDSLAVPKKFYGFQVFIGLGFGLSVSTLTVIATLESELRDNAVAQGIIAQMRILGGSIGIAASTAILGGKLGSVSEQELEALKSAPHTLSAMQMQTIRTAYTEAFNKTMWINAIISGICAFAAIGTWNGRYDVRKKRAETIEREMRRQSEMAIAAARDR